MAVACGATGASAGSRSCEALAAQNSGPAAAGATADASDAPAHWPDGVKSVSQEGRVISILASDHAEAIRERARAIPGATVEQFPVTLKEIFMEYARSH